MPEKKQSKYISPTELAPLLEGDAEAIREGLRNGTFPVGFAFKGKDSWIFKIPRDAAMELVESGVMQSKYIKTAAEKLQKESMDCPKSTALALMYHAVCLCSLYGKIETESIVK